ncbi:MAG: DUF3089 domain-containing protein [Pseudomonadota bacterium]|nr:DUF3089 domain-containing protein [Pseudomonadota bacterium]
MQYRRFLAATVLAVSSALSYADAPDYQTPDQWLCHPDQADTDNVCLRPQDTVAVSANGARTFDANLPANRPEVDCFYIYPTASMDLTARSNMQPDAQERDTTAIQFGRYSQVCRQFAPVYRQRTLTYLGIGALSDGLVTEETLQEANEVAYRDVRTAFEHYMNHDNNGRGVLLVGHSQGARLLARLIADTIEGTPQAEQLVAAHLIGTQISVPYQGVVGGTFASTPLCQAPGQTGCVVAYSSFREGDPELATPRFGASPGPGYEAACTHPASLMGGQEALDARLPFKQPYAFGTLLKIQGSGGPYENWWTNQKIKQRADYFAVPGQFYGECVRNEDGTHYLEVRIDSDPNDPRADDYRGELIVVKGWGLHLIDVSLAQEDLVRLAGDQAQAWLSR